MFAYYLQLIVNLAVGFIGAYLFYHNGGIKFTDAQLLNHLLNLLGIALIWTAAYLIQYNKKTVTLFANMFRNAKKL